MYTYVDVRLAPVATMYFCLPFGYRSWFGPPCMLNVQSDFGHRQLPIFCGFHIFLSSADPSLPKPYFCCFCYTCQHFSSLFYCFLLLLLCLPMFYAVRADDHKLFTLLFHLYEDIHMRHIDEFNLPTAPLKECADAPLKECAENKRDKTIQKVGGDITVPIYIYM